MLLPCPLVPGCPSGSARPVHSGHARLVRGLVRGADRGPGAGLAGHRGRASTRSSARPTGSGKTLAAFLWCLDRLRIEEPPTDPLSASASSTSRRSRRSSTTSTATCARPLAGIGLAARATRRARRATSASGCAPATRPPTSAAPSAASPPDILVTTPESLYLILTSQAREALRSVRWVIVDEIHALASTKRGAHLALSLERLEALTARRRSASASRPPQRPLVRGRAYLGGRQPQRRPGSGAVGAGRPRGP